jgi:lysophospholipase L1-like esterase
MDAPLQYGHLSVKGNALIADMVYEQLAPRLKSAHVLDQQKELHN